MSQSLPLTEASGAYALKAPIGVDGFTGPPNIKPWMGLAVPSAFRRVSPFGALVTCGVKAARSFRSGGAWVVWGGLFLLPQFFPPSTAAQVVPAFRAPARISGFATFTDAKPNFRGAEDFAVYGGSAGAFIQTEHVAGIEVRGSVLKWGGQEHQESALGGLRAALHFARWSPYIAVLGGATNAWWPETTAGRRVWHESVGPEWSALGGVDFYVHRGISLRLGEVSFSQIYVKDRTLTPLAASAGIVFRFPLLR